MIIDIASVQLQQLGDPLCITAVITAGSEMLLLTHTAARYTVLSVLRMNSVIWTCSSLQYSLELDAVGAVTSTITGYRFRSARVQLACDYWLIWLAANNRSYRYLYTLDGRRCCS